MLMWCSFVDPDLPKGTRFLGVVVIEAADIVEAATKAHELGINPGGEVLAAEIPAHLEPGPAYRNRLLDKDEATRLANSMDEVSRRHQTKET